MTHCKSKTNRADPIYLTLSKATCCIFIKFIPKMIPTVEEERTFVVVRDPLRRLLSAYRDKIEQLRETFFKNPAREMILHHRPVRWNIHFRRDKSAQEAIDHAEAMTKSEVLSEEPDVENPYLYPPYPTFREFVAEVIAGWGNPHIVPATQYCGPCSPTKK